MQCFLIATKIMIATVFILLTNLVSQSFAATRVVPNNYRTIQAAVNAANSGDTILVKKGIYKEEVIINKSNLTIKSENKYGAHIQGNHTKQTGFTGNKGVNNLIIDGFEISGQKYAGILMNRNSNQFSGWEIRNNKIHHIWELGILARGKNHDIHDNEVFFIGNHQESMGIKIESDATTVRRNQVYAVAKNGIRNSMTNNTVRDNIVFYAAVCIASNSSAGGAEIYNNFLYDCSDGYKPKHLKCIRGRHDKYEQFYHNTIHDVAHSAIEIGINDPPTYCVRIKNNILSANSNTEAAILRRVERTFKLDIEGNLYHATGTPLYREITDRTSYKTLKALQANTPFANQSQEADPLIFDHQTGIHYRKGSPAFQGSLLLKTPFGKQLGAHGLVQTVQKIDKVTTLKAIDASIGKNTIARLTDGRDNPLWKPGVNRGWVTLELNRGNPATFEVFSYWGWVKKNGNVKTFRLEKSENRNGPWTQILTDGGRTHTLGGRAMFELDKPVTTKYLRFHIDSVWNNKDVVISEIVVFNFNRQPSGSSSEGRGNSPPDPPQNLRVNTLYQN